MSDVVIRAEGLGKRYLIGHETERESYVALRDVMARSARKLVQSAGDLLRGRQLLTGNEIEEFWALKDVNFEIRRGEVVGIIGRNGAGKSTLLKILSRITEPTTGRVEILGRVASLLEVGTGFHPELTGRENIFLNGAILGMSRAEIKRKFDEIVDFAEVEKFLDTPVKRYSSGMYVRLAFAVAAHLEPEILIVDEVLAVGDAEFQKKCLGKMKDVSGGGRTVLVVSHNIGTMESLCTSGYLLADGMMLASGAIHAVASAYRKRMATAPAVQICGNARQCTIALQEICVLGADQSAVDVVASGAPVKIVIRYRPIPSGTIQNVTVAMPFRNSRTEIVLLARSNFAKATCQLEGSGGALIFTFPKLPLSPGTYKIDIRIIRDSETLLLLEQALTLRVEGNYFYQNSAAPPPRIECALPEFSFESEAAI